MPAPHRSSTVLPAARRSRPSWLPLPDNTRTARNAARTRPSAAAQPPTPSDPSPKPADTSSTTPASTAAAAVSTEPSSRDSSDLEDGPEVSGSAVDSVPPPHWSDDADGDSAAASGSETEDSDEIARQEMFDRIMNPVIKVFCRHTEPNFSLPWQREQQYGSSSSGFAVQWGPEGQRWLLTNAHSVDYHSQVRVKKRGDDEKYLASVLAMGTECDLALLQVEDDSFWEGIQPMALGPMPHLQEHVAVVGYPVGGDTISVTAGVVSRIEVTSYIHGSMQLLGVQIDAAINSGNSGGPVFNEVGRLVGMAFQSFAGSEVENVGWVIPTSVIRHFLDDYDKNTAYTGFPMLGVAWQRMESPALKRQMLMEKKDRGVLVTHVAATGSAAGVLEQGDVLMAFDGAPISSDGTTPFRTGERIMFSYLVSQRFVGERVRVTVRRAGKVVDLEMTLAYPTFLVPPHLSSKDPSYYVVSGLVFTVASEPYLVSEFGADFTSLAPVGILQKVFYERAASRDEQVVLLSQVLASNATVGYEDTSNVQVLKFNGEPIKNLRQLVDLVEGSTDAFLKFELSYDSVLVLDTAEARESTAAMLSAHSIPHQMSADLRNGGAGGAGAAVDNGAGGDGAKVEPARASMA